MKAGIFVVVLAVVAGALAGVAHAGEPTAEQAAALQRLQAASTTPVSADFADGAPRFVSATVAAEGVSASDRALSYLDRFRDLYGLGEPRSQLQVVRQTGNGEAQDVFFVELESLPTRSHDGLRHVWVFHEAIPDRHVEYAMAKLAHADLLSRRQEHCRSI